MGAMLGRSGCVQESRSSRATSTLRVGCFIVFPIVTSSTPLSSPTVRLRYSCGHKSKSRADLHERMPVPSVSPSGFLYNGESRNQTAISGRIMGKMTRLMDLKVRGHMRIVNTMTIRNLMYEQSHSSSIIGNTGTLEHGKRAQNSLGCPRDPLVPQRLLVEATGATLTFGYMLLIPCILLDCALHSSGIITMSLPHLAPAYASNA